LPVTSSSTIWSVIVRPADDRDDFALLEVASATSRMAVFSAVSAKPAPEM
jgi:hypothetical protein